MWIGVQSGGLLRAPPGRADQEDSHQTNSNTILTLGKSASTTSTSKAGRKAIIQPYNYGGNHMKVIEHVEQLLRQGRKPAELIKFGFSKSVVTRVRRRLRKEKAALQRKEPEGAPQAETQLPTPPESPEEIATIWQKVQPMANDLQRIDSLGYIVTIHPYCHSASE